MKHSRLIILVAVIISQVIFVCWMTDRERIVSILHPYTENPNPKAQVEAGQIWAYKCSLPFHENDSPTYRKVKEVRNGYVKYQYGGSGDQDEVCDMELFLVDATLLTNADWPTK